MQVTGLEYVLYDHDEAFETFDGDLDNIEEEFPHGMIIPLFGSVCKYLESFAVQRKGELQASYRLRWMTRC